jgi:3'-phosphoadenosine 5'-phosphosulfate sulfotransferase (PAPS reductase)/FAD synthetase
MNFVVFVSYGNDSVALLQHMHEIGAQDVSVLYSDTGWAADN